MSQSDDSPTSHTLRSEVEITATVLTDNGAETKFRTSSRAWPSLLPVDNSSTWTLKDVSIKYKESSMASACKSFNTEGSSTFEWMPKTGKLTLSKEDQEALSDYSQFHLTDTIISRPNQHKDTHIHIRGVLSFVHKDDPSADDYLQGDLECPNAGPYEATSLDANPDLLSNVNNGADKHGFAALSMTIPEFCPLDLASGCDLVIEWGDRPEPTKLHQWDPVQQKTVDWSLKGNLPYIVDKVAIPVAVITDDNKTRDTHLTVQLHPMSVNEEAYENETNEDVA